MYNSYFGFLESPFSVTPDPRFFYTNPIYQEAYAIPRYGIEAKKGFIVVTGEVGTGKTTLLRKLMRNLEDTVHNLNWVFAGQDLLLPRLTKETLLRKQPDGSYRLIVGSLRSPTGADEYARLLSNKGYQVAITPRRVSDNLLLYRVEMDG
jgi:energy-coupling factor transporter ATP-binding protein EcfA2